MNLKRLFISHSSKDNEFVRRLVSDIEKQGVDTWLDLKNLPPGKLWRVQELPKAMKASHGLLLIVSPDAISSRNVGAEYGHFWDLELPIYPIICHKADTSAFQGLPEIQSLDFSSEEKYVISLKKLVEELQKDGFVQKKSLVDVFGEQTASQEDASSLLEDAPVLPISGEDGERDWIVPLDGNAELYGSLLISEHNRESVNAIKAIGVIAEKTIQEWWDSISDSEKEMQKATDRSVRPRYIAGLIGLLFDESDAVAAQAMRTLESWGLLHKIPGLFFLIGYAALYRPTDVVLSEALVVIDRYATQDDHKWLVYLQELLGEKLRSEMVYSKDDPRQVFIKRLNETIGGIVND